MRTLSTKSSKLSVKCETGNIPLFISLTLGIILFIIIITSLSKIEKLANCDCSKIPYKDYVKEWFVFMIFFYIVGIILFSVSNFECWDMFVSYPPMFIIKIIISLVTLIMFIKLFLYLREIRKNCNCAYGNKESFLYWFFIIYFAIIASLIIISIILIILATVIYFIK